MMLARFSLIPLVMSIVAVCASCSRSSDEISVANGSDGKLVTLYFHQANSVVAGFATPGLLKCDPQIADRYLSRYFQMRRDEPIDWRRPLPQKKEREQEQEELLALLRNTFSPLPDADWSEGEYYTAQETQKAEIAVGFARKHNRAAYRTGETQIRRLCPQAQLD